MHCETGTGILNPLPQIAAVVAKHGRGLIVDAMSSYGAIPIDARTIRFDALIAASGKCLEGVPGMGFVIARRAVLERSRRQQRIARHGSPRSVAVHAEDGTVALHAADPRARGSARRDRPIPAAGRADARGWRATRENCAALVSGMRALGFKTFLPDALQAPIIVTFHSPSDPNYDFAQFYRRVRERGFILYPGKLTAVDTFRVGCIGAIGADALTAGGGGDRRHFARDGRACVLKCRAESVAIFQLRIGNFHIVVF